MEDIIYREIVSVDLKGRLTIPKYIRDEIGLVEGGKVVVEVDRLNKKLIIKPVDVKTQLCSVVGEKINDIGEFLNELAKYRDKAFIDILDLRCYKVFDGGYECRAIISIRGHDGCGVLENISKLLLITSL